MFVRQTVVPVGTAVRVSFNEDGRERVVELADPVLAHQLVENRATINAANAQCQSDCTLAEEDFNRLAKEAELEYQRKATALRAEADAKIKAAQDRQKNDIAFLAQQRDQLEDAAFRKAELQLIQDAKLTSIL